MIDAVLASLVVLGLLGFGFVTYFYVMSRLALRGTFGVKQQWAAELMREDDEFAEAVKALSEEQIMLVANTSMSKRQLRENVLLAYEQSDES